MTNRLPRRHLLPVVVTRRRLPVVTRRRLRRVGVTRRHLLPVVVTRHLLPVVVIRRLRRSRAGTSHLRQLSRSIIRRSRATIPAPGGYPPPAGPGYPGAQALNVGEAFSWAWNKFSKNAAALIVPTLVYGAIIFVVQLIFGVVSALVDSPDATSYTSDGSSFSLRLQQSSPASFAVPVIGWIVALLVVRRHPVRVLRGILDIANGQPVTIGSFFKPRNVGNVVIASLIVGILTFIGFSFCIHPGCRRGHIHVVRTVIIARSQPLAD